jgi:hypothetical protein
VQICRFSEIIGRSRDTVKIGIIIHRIGDVDGVALETEKWIHVLNKMEPEIVTWAVRNKIDVLLSGSASALPCHLSMGLGIKRAVDSMDIPIVSHEHVDEHNVSLSPESRSVASAVIGY